MPLPQLDVVREGEAPLPIESLPANNGTAAAAESGIMGTIGGSLESQALGAWYGTVVKGDNRMVPHDKAVEWMKSQGYDAASLPDGDMQVGTLAGISNQQSIIKRDQEIMQDAHMSDTWRTVTTMAGGAADPLFLLGGPILGKVVGVGAEGLNLSRAGRAAVGGLEAGGAMAGYTEAEKHLGSAPGDADINSYDVARGAIWGSLLGTAGGAATRAPVKAPMDLRTIATLENTAGYAKTHGINPDEVTSKTGAVGLYQVEPGTARDMGVTGDLKDPKVNAEAAQRYLDHLARQFGNDPEAIAVAYNAGPGRAAQWIKAGRDDSVLPSETQGYLARLRKMQPAADTEPVLADAKQATMEAVHDVEPSSLRTNPFRIRDEHEAEVRSIESDAFERAAKYKPNSLFHSDPEIKAVQDRIAANDTGPTTEFDVPAETEDEVVTEAKTLSDTMHLEDRTLRAEDLGFTPNKEGFLEGDLAAAGKTLKSTADAALARGAKVKLHTEGKEIDIVAPGMKDKNGNAWGAISLLASNDMKNARLEIKEPARPPEDDFATHMADTNVSEEAATLTNEDVVKAVKSAVLCGITRGID